MLSRLMGALPLPRKHRFSSRVRNLETVTVYWCRGCGATRFLDGWEIRTLPLKEARCRNGRIITVAEAMQMLLSPHNSYFDCYEGNDG